MQKLLNLFKQPKFTKEMDNYFVEEEEETIHTQFSENSEKYLTKEDISFYKKLESYVIKTEFFLYLAIIAMLSMLYNFQVSADTKTIIDAIICLPFVIISAIGLYFWNKDVMDLEDYWDLRHVLDTIHTSQIPFNIHFRSLFFIAILFTTDLNVTAISVFAVQLILTVAVMKQGNKVNDIQQKLETGGWYG